MLPRNDTVMVPASASLGFHDRTPPLTLNGVRLTSMVTVSPGSPVTWGSGCPGVGAADSITSARTDTEPDAADIRGV